MHNLNCERPLLRGLFQVYNQKPTHIDLTFVKQIHSNIIVPENVITPQLEADGIISHSGQALAIVTADCVPLIILGKHEHIVIHAGWRGLNSGILTNELVKKINPIYAFIGPHIRKQSYEVSSDFKLNFPRHPEAFESKENKLFFDLSLVCTRELRDNYSDIQIEDCNICTFENPEFHSYRRNKTTQRNWNIFFPS